MARRLTTCAFLGALLWHQAAAQSPPAVTTSNHSARPKPQGIPNDDGYYVIMGIYRLVIGIAYHGAVISCPKSSFSSDEQRQLDDAISKNYWTELNENWWGKSDITCKLIQYGGDDDTQQCSCISFDDAQTHEQPLSSLHANGEQFSSSGVWKYIYGTGSMDVDTVHHEACDQPIPSGDINWSCHTYNAVEGPNCNTFVSFVLKCAYGLSDKKPDIGASDPMSITCNGNNGAAWAGPSRRQNATLVV